MNLRKHPIERAPSAHGTSSRKSSPVAASMLKLQRTAGNGAISRLLAVQRAAARGTKAPPRTKGGVIGRLILDGVGKFGVGPDFTWSMAQGVKEFVEQRRDAGDDVATAVDLDDLSFTTPQATAAPLLELHHEMTTGRGDPLRPLSGSLVLPGVTIDLSDVILVSLSPVGTQSVDVRVAIGRARTSS